MCGGSKDGSWIDRELQLARNVWNQQESLPEYPEDPEVATKLGVREAFKSNNR